MSTEAQKEYSRAHYWNNRDRHLQYHKARYHIKKTEPEFRQKRRQYSKQYAERNKEKLKVQRREWQLKNRVRRLASERARHYQKNYGITILERDALFAANNGLCYICSKRPSEVVDHDHGTGRVRGALCHPCNRMLGAIYDEPEVLLAAADYLRRELCSIS